MQPDEFGADGSTDQEQLDGSGGDTTPAEVVQQLQPDATQKQEQLETSKEINDALNELDQADKDSVETTNAVQKTFDAAAALESMHNAIASFSGKPSKADIDMVNLAMEDFCVMFDLKKQYQVAMEEIDPITDDFLGSLASFVWDKVVKLWKIIIEMITHMLTKFADLITKIFAMSRIIYSRTKRLMAKASRLKGNATSEFIDGSDILPAIHIDGKAPTNIVSDVSYLFYMSEGVFQEVNRWTADVGQTIGQWLETVNVTRVANPPVIPGVKIPYGETKEIYAPKDAIGGKIPYTRVIGSPILLGGRRMITRIMDTSRALSFEEASDVYPWIGSFIHHEQNDQTLVSNTSLNVMPLRDVTTVLKYIADTTSNILAFEKQARSNKQIRNNILAGAKRVEEEISQLKSSENREAIEFAKNAALAAPRIVEQPASQFSIYFLHTAAKLLDYAEASMDSYI